jgi:hypothetical protein
VCPDGLRPGPPRRESRLRDGPKVTAGGARAQSIGASTIPIDKSSKVSDYEDDSGDTFIAFTRKGLSGGGVAIRDSLAN